MILTPLKSHFYIVKLGFTGVYIIFLISAQIDCGYSLEPPRRGGSNEYPQSMPRAEIWKISEFLSENFQFLVVKFSIYLNRSVFVTNTFTELKTAKVSDETGFLWGLGLWVSWPWFFGAVLRRAVNPNIVDNIAFPFACRMVTRASDWVTAAPLVCFGGLVLVCRYLCGSCLFLIFSSVFASGGLRFEPVAFPGKPYLHYCFIIILKIQISQRSDTIW